MSLIDDADPEVAATAADLCAFRQIPGTQEHLAARLSEIRGSEPRHGYRQDLALKLAKVADRPQVVQMLLPYLFQDRPERYDQWTGYALRRALAHPDPGVSGPMRRALHQYTLSFTGAARYDQSLVHDLADTADLASLPVLRDIYACATDKVSRWYALGAMARLEPDRALDMVLECVRRDGPYDMLLDLLRQSATEADAERVLAAVLPPENRPPTRPLKESFARLLLENLGANGRRALEARPDLLDPGARQWAMWKLHGLDLRSALAELRDAHIIEMDTDALLAKMQDAGVRRARELGWEAKPVDTTEPSTIYGALATVDLLTVFDVETSMVPCDHDGLIMTFTHGSAGHFRPECPIQIWHAASDDDFDAPYTVQFLFNGRLYRFGAENFGDWYDVHAVPDALNFALADAGFRQRFIALATGGQIAEFVFADPSAFVPIAERYGIPLSADPSEAMRAGKEYERQIFEKPDGAA
ncbi:MAG TPA: hypothetical protein VGI81_18360 [Tepidisphaeraceae bacterium]